jgi:predicted O-methyltransferase YrrM
VPRDDVTLSEDLSTSDQAIAFAGKRHYDVLVIDGDHSYAGVKADFENYLGMMRPGGFIIFDDFNSEDWPDVQRYVDNEVKGREDLAFIGAEWRTAIFQVAKRPTDE